MAVLLTPIAIGAAEAITEAETMAADEAGIAMMFTGMRHFRH